MILILQDHQGDQSNQRRCDQQDPIHMGQPVASELMLIISLSLFSLLPLLYKIPDIRHGISHLPACANMPVYFRLTL